MDIRLDPRLPLVWRDPHTVQIGTDQAVVVLSGVTARHERILSAIAAGQGRSGAGAVAQRAGCREAEVVEIVQRLGPALLQPGSRPPPSIHIAGSSPLADEIRLLVASTGALTESVGTDAAEVATAPTLGVAVSDHVHDPVLAGVWLRRDVPHLHVVAGDRSTRIGPVVVPGSTACAHCLDLHRAEVDSAWGVIAGQLYGRKQVAPTLLATRDVAVRAARRALARASGDEPRLSDAVIETVDTETGVVTRSTSRPHPACGCATLPRIGSGDDPTALDPAPDDSTKGAAVAALA